MPPKPLFPAPVAMPLKPVAGIEKYGWLNRLKNSVRNSTPILSPMLVFLKMAKSKLSMPGPRSDESTRPSLPNPHSGGAAKQFVLNHSVRLREPLLLHPGTTSGRMLPTPKLAASSEVAPPAQVTFNGK